MNIKNIREKVKEGDKEWKIKQRRLSKRQKKAVKVIKSNMPTSGYLMLRESLAMAISALNRCIPIEADYEGDSCDENGDPIYDTWICPNCGEKYEIGFDDYDYCPNCGQRVIVHEV